jgi:peptidoglycan hydrolase-like protein with peptidoglycan-binding domain
MRVTAKLRAVRAVRAASRGGLSRRCGGGGLVAAVVGAVTLLLAVPAAQAAEPVAAPAPSPLAAGPLGGLAELTMRLSLGSAEDVLSVGSASPRVLMLQERLAGLGYRPGPADGVYGAQTASAVLAFQKVEGLERDSAAGPAVFDLLVAPRGAGPRGGGPGIEVDISRQVVFAVGLGGRDLTIMNASSGNDEWFEFPDGSTAVATTPRGSYAVGHRIDDTEVAPLGTLYRPMYFTGPFAIHGSTSVPAWPASHGCVRLSYPDQDWLYPNTPTGTGVWVYD